MLNLFAKRFVNLFLRMGATGDSLTAFNDIANRYSEPQRHYHTLEHVVHCLREFDKAKHLTDSRDIIECAIWFHDVIYNPSRFKDNEERSAMFASSVLLRATVGIPVRARVIDLILSTKHADIVTDVDTQLLMDVDLSIFGTSEDQFDLYERQIREEYRFVKSEKAFAMVRSGMLQSFMDRERIYFTSFFQDRYESQARHNLMRSIDQLLSSYDIAS